MAAVKDRLTKEITYWDHRAEQLKIQEQTGRPARGSIPVKRESEPTICRHGLKSASPSWTARPRFPPLPPVVHGWPCGRSRRTARRDDWAVRAGASRPADTQASAARARAIVMELERSLGFEPVDRELEKLGYDIESRNVREGPDKGKLRFIEVKGRVTGADTVTVTKNEILYSLNKPDDFILAIVEFLDGETHRVHYLRQPFRREPDFCVTSVNYNLAELISKAEAPA